MTLERGTLLHKRYRIVEILGQGGMGSVYRAVDENLGVDVALKENLFTTDEYSRQFRLEAVILANLRHPNLPRVSDHFVVGDQGQYLVMDYIEGEDLRQRMERVGTIGEDEAISIGAAMCDALAYLHTRKPPILHRDLKPGNVKITPDGHIFLVDFGLAKVVQGSQATTTGARAMTPGYSPPEQYGTARTDPRTDIYSLGATLYASLSGIIPEDGLARAMDNAQLTPLRKRNSKVSKRLAAVIEKAMSIDPAERYQLADEFQRALLSSKSKTQQLTGNYVIAPPPPESETPPAAEKPKSRPAGGSGGPPYPPEDNGDDKPFTPKKKRKNNGGGGCLPRLLLLALLILAGYLTWNYMPGAREQVNEWVGLFRPIPVTQLTDIPPSPTDEPTATAALTGEATNGAAATSTSQATKTPTKAPTSTPTQTATSLPEITPTPAATKVGGGFGQFAFVSNRTGVPQVYISNDNGSEQTVLTNMPDGACQPAWSPDGTRLIFTSPCEARESTFINSSLYIINADGTGLAPLFEEPNGDFDPAWSPDGKRLAFASWRIGRPSIYSYDFEAETVSLLVESTGNFMESRQPAWSPFNNQIVYIVKKFNVFEIWSMTDTGKGQVQLVYSGGGFFDLQPTWAQDGKRILFSQRSIGPSDYWLMEFNMESREIDDGSRLNIGPTPIENVEFSPDGLWLVFESVADEDNRDIFIMTIDGVTLIRITLDPGTDFDPTWRPIQTP
jgi:serine/threonine protein kinase/Tol biopolymer transport system component